MEVVILGGSRQIGKLAADAIEQLIRRKPDAVLGLATGSSPLPVYDELAARHERGLDFSDATGGAWTCSCWAWAPTATSGSTNPVPPLHPARGSRA